MTEEWSYGLPVRVAPPVIEWSNGLPYIITEVTGVLPVSTDLLGMDYACCAQPFVEVPTKSAVVLTGMDYVYLAQPFVRNPSGEPTYPFTLNAVQHDSHIDLTWSEP